MLLSNGPFIANSCKPETVPYSYWAIYDMLVRAKVIEKRPYK